MNAIVEAIAGHAASTPDKQAVIIGKESLTYAELWRGILSASHDLRAIAENSVIILAAEKKLGFICYYFAAHLRSLGCVLVDPKASSESLNSIIQTLPVRAYFSSSGDLPDVPSFHYQTACSDFEENFSFPALDTVADYMFTTGTTGVSKCVPLTHENLLASAHNINTFIGNNQSDHEIIALPLCHSFGLGRLRCAMLAGGTCTILPNFANERKLLKLLSSESITGFSMVPAAWQYISHLCRDRFIEAAQNLRFIEIGSAALPIHDKIFLEENLPATKICMHYGLTEASRSAFIEFHADRDKLTTCGKPTPNVEIAIFSSHGSRLTAGETGEVCVRGKHVTRGYLSIGREQCFYGDFFRTGDMGMIDAEGYLHLLGRIKELINVGGKKVAPDEVEHKLNQLPGVLESACVAACDPEGILGEVVKAYIVPVEGEEIDCKALQSMLRKQLEPHKVPRIIEIRNIPIPRTESGKIQRQKLS